MAATPILTMKHLTLALMLALPLAASASRDEDAERERERQFERASRDAERQLNEQLRNAQRESERAAREAERDVDRELREAQRELRVVAARVAELTQRASQADMERAMSRPAFGRPVVGVILQVDRETGVRLAGVTPNSSAAKGGLRAGDRIVAIDGHRIDKGDAEQRIDYARELLADLQDGQRVQIDYERAGREARVDVKASNLPGLAMMGRAMPALAARPEALTVPLEALSPTPFNFEMVTPEALVDCDRHGEGCQLGPLADALRWRGLRLARVEPRLGRYFGTEHGVLVLSSDDKLGDLQPGDVLLEVDGDDVRDPGDAMRALRGREPGEKIALSVLRDRRRIVVDVDAPNFSRLPMYLPPTPPAAPAPPAPPAQPAVPGEPAPAAAPAPPTPPARLLGWHDGEPVLIATPRATPEPRRRGVLEQSLSGRPVD